MHHSFILSDVHLADSEPEDRSKPLWRRYKLAQHFPDASFARFLEHIQDLASRSPRGAPAELILNGDIFDFDVVVQTPSSTEARELGIEVSWIERLRGLSPTEPKSRWKMRQILAEHGVFLRALHDFLQRGHRAVFIIGNHDLELHWASVRQLVIDALDLPAGFLDRNPERLRFCAWFYRSGGDTLVTHGNQMDPYCLCHDPLHPFVKGRGPLRVRLPFGDLAGKFLANGIGWFNPHVPETFVRSMRQWVVFFYRTIARHQPFILFTWLWSAVGALTLSLRDGFLPPVRDPELLEARLDEVAKQANATPGMALALRAVDVHPAVFRPWKLMRELWLDRALLLLLIGVGSFQLVSTLHFFAGISGWWIVAVLSVLLVPFVFYARQVDSDVEEVERNIEAHAPRLARVSRTRRVVMGHTHGGMHRVYDGVEYINTGHWAPGFSDLECMVPHGLRGFAWIRPGEEGERRAELRRWLDPGSEQVPPPPELARPRVAGEPSAEDLARSDEFPQPAAR